ncbi:MAG: hypothetical protein VX716_02370 [SAR324 cluster bacterium]|nr:hypothetical protein [SAR324 cluster bacterium]
MRVVKGERGVGKSPFSSPLIRPDGHLLPQEEGFSSQSAAVDSATSGKPFVQNDMRLR